jgi:hypothetical protein
MRRICAKTQIAVGVLGLAGLALAAAPLAAATGPPPVLSALICPRTLTAQQGHARFLVGARLSIPARFILRITRVSDKRVLKTVTTAGIHKAGRVFLLVQATDSRGYQLSPGAYTVFIGATSAHGRNAHGRSFALTLTYTAPRGVFDWYTVPNDGDIRASLGLHTSVGQVVAAVHPGSAVASAGILRGDVIMRINGIGVTTPGGFARAMRLLSANTPVPVELLRGPSPMSVTVTAPPDWKATSNLTAQLGTAAASTAFGYRYALASYDVAIGNLAAASKVMAAWSKATAGTATAQLAHAQLMVAEHNQPRALAFWSRALALDGSLAPAAFGQGIAYDAMGNDPAAANAFAHAAGLDPASGADPAYQALALEQVHLPYLALPSATAAVSQDPTDPNALAALGVVQIQTGQRASGVPTLERGLGLTDDPARAQFLISTFLEPSVP